MFAIRGTDDLRDAVISDAQLAIGVSLEQFEISARFFQQFIDNNINTRNIFLTGHSLGGGIASMLSAYHGLPVVTFNAPGAVRSFVSLKTSGICSGIIRNFPPLQELCVLSREFIRSNVNETQMLNVRASLDAVSVGTGDAFGQIVDVTIETHFDFDVSDVLLPIKGIGSAIGQGVAMLASQHSMSEVVSAVQGVGSSFFIRYGWS